MFFILVYRLVIFVGMYDKRIITLWGVGVKGGKVAVLLRMYKEDYLLLFCGYYPHPVSSIKGRF